MNRIREISEWSESGFVEKVRYDHVSSNGQMRFVDLNVPGEDETPFSLTPILVHPHVRGVWGAPSEVRRVFVHRCLTKKKTCSNHVNRLSSYLYKLDVPSEVYFVLFCRKGVGRG